jgi:hypothetical protein
VHKAINTFFGQVYVINLKSRADRRAEMNEQLRHIGLSFDSPNVLIYETMKPSDPAGFPSVGVRGCFMSHLAVLREARNKGVKSVLILEDDLNFCENFSARFSTAATWLEGFDWGMFYGSYFLARPPEYSEAPCIQIDPGELVGTTAFLAVNGNHFEALIDYLEAMLGRPPGDAQGGPMHIDGAYCWFRHAHPDVLSFLANGPLGFQRSSKTDVHALRWYDRTPWTALIVSQLRRWRNLLRRR